MAYTLAHPTEKPHVIAGPMSYEEFLQWDGENQHVEWVNGEVYSTAPVSDAHNGLTVFLTNLLSRFAEATDDGRIFVDPFQMKTSPDLPGRAPDLMFVLRKNSHRIKKLYLDGPADLVIEVISPGTRGVDRGDKYVEYEEGRVPEYWLLDADRRRFEFYQLGENGQYALATNNDDGIFRSRSVPGLWIRLEWLSRRPYPKMSSIAREWGLL